VVNKTFKLSKEDQKYLISIICRYRSTQTSINEQDEELTVWTTFAGNKQPISRAAKFKMELISEDPPKMPDNEYQRLIFGFPRKNV
jgi:hypothetical protein